MSSRMPQKGVKNQNDIEPGESNSSKTMGEHEPNIRTEWEVRLDELKSLKKKTKSEQKDYETLRRKKQRKQKSRKES